MDIPILFGRECYSIKMETEESVLDVAHGGTLAAHRTFGVNASEGYSLNGPSEFPRGTRGRTRSSL